MNKELKENIMQGTLQAFNQKGLKFTMDDIAKILGISKKTIYQVFRDKEALFLETVDYLFDRIKDSEQKIVENPEMDTLRKIAIKETTVFFPHMFQLGNRLAQVV